MQEPQELPLEVMGTLDRKALAPEPPPSAPLPAAASGADPLALVTSSSRPVLSREILPMTCVRTDISFGCRLITVRCESAAYCTSVCMPSKT